MKSDRRHELEKNVLADRLGSGLQAAQPILPLVVGAIAIAAIGWIGWAIYSSTTKSKAAVAWSDYYFNMASQDAKAFTEVAEDFPNSTAASSAHQTAGNQLLQSGVEALYRNRAEGEKLLKQAIESFEAASQSKQPEVSSRALYGLGKAYESLGELDKAAEYYDRVSSGAVFPALGTEADNRLAFVTSDAGKQFYNWFSQLNPQPDLPIQLPGDLTSPPTSPGGLDFDSLAPLGGGAPLFDPGTLPPLDPADVPSGTPSPEPGGSATDGGLEIELDDIELPAVEPAAGDPQPAAGESEVELKLPASDPNP